MSANFQVAVADGKTKEETLDLYEKWATDYETDMNDVGWRTPANVAAVVMETVKPEEGTKIVDFAAGTGSLARCLRLAGLPPSVLIHAVDASKEMLRIAKEKNIYGETFVSFIGGGAELPFEKESYDLATMSGAFVPGHVPLDGWDFVLDAVKPGGHAVCSITKKWLETTPEYFQMDKYIAEMCQRKGANLRERRVFEKSLADNDLIVWVVQKDSQ